jgi:hypothetical protein
MPEAGYAASPSNYYGGTQYPVTPYPPSSLPGAAPGSGGYMPPADPYSAGATSNPYAAAATANPYAASSAPASPYSASPYAATTAPPPSYTASGQYPSAPNSGGPYTSGDSPYAYR